MRLTKDGFSFYSSSLGKQRKMEEILSSENNVGSLHQTLRKGEGTDSKISNNGPFRAFCPRCVRTGPIWLISDLWEKRPAPGPPSLPGPFFKR